MNVKYIRLLSPRRYLLPCLFPRSIVNSCTKWSFKFISLNVDILLSYVVHYLKFFVLQPSINGTCVTYRWIVFHPVEKFCLYLRGLSNNRPNTITKILSSIRYHPVSYGCQRHTDPPLCHSTVEYTPMHYMYAEATHCRTVCYLLVTSSRT